MLGKAAVVIWCDVRPEARAEFEDWHSHEHLPERLAIPGFLRGSRWVGASGESTYFMLYELDDPTTLSGPAYLARLNDPTPWSRKMMPEHRNMVRSLCVVRERFGGGLPHTLATIRFHSADRRTLPRPKSATGVFLLQSQAMPAAQTTEQKIRGNDRAAGWVGLLGGYDEDEIAAAARALAAQGTVGVYRLSYSLAAGEMK
jgi:hypothetical protein